MSNKPKVQLYDQENEKAITPVVDIEDINITNDNIKNTGVLYDNYLPFYREDSSGVYLKNMDSNLSGGNKNDFVIGKNNVPDSSSLFTVGCGDNNRHNALLITDDGSVYIGDKEDKNKVAIQDDINTIYDNINTIINDINDISTDISVMATKTDINTINNKTILLQGAINIINNDISVLDDIKRGVDSRHSIIVNDISNNKNSAYYSYVGGKKCENNCNVLGSFVHGYGLKVDKNVHGGFTCGRYNDSSKAHIFAVGIGTSDEDRKNAFWINEDNNAAYFEGDIYEKGKKLSEKYNGLRTIISSSINKNYAELDNAIICNIANSSGTTGILTIQHNNDDEIIQFKILSPDTITLISDENAAFKKRISNNFSFNSGIYSKGISLSYGVYDVIGMPYYNSSTYDYIYYVY